MKIITFLDSINRCMFGELVEEQTTDTILAVKNPAVVNVTPQIDPASGRPTGQMALHLVPVFFREFLADKSDPMIYYYNKSVITITNDIAFNFRLRAQYEQLNTFETPQAAQPAPQPSDKKVINLFDK